MAYHTNLYLFLFLPAVLLMYQMAPRRWRSGVLLCSSYLFFASISKGLVIYLAGSTLLTYGTGLALLHLKQKCSCETAEVARAQAQNIREKFRKKEKLVLLAGIFSLVFLLGYLKYYNFFADNLNRLVERAGGASFLSLKKLAVPVGISFYTLEAIGYMMDVYWDRIVAERRPWKLALFLSFFPKMMEGPICSYSALSEQLGTGDALKSENLTQGFVRILWGLFKKMVVADRLYLMVNTVFDNYKGYSGMVIVIGAIAYTIQLYMEFSGSIDIVIGSGRLFGIVLPENFRQPFCAVNAADFWRRWHISLGVWLKTYVFYPVSVSEYVKRWNRFARKRFGKYWAKVGLSALCLFPVWFLNGLWHGAKWSYLFYGMYYFVILLIGVMAEPLGSQVRKVLHVKENSRWWRCLQIGKTWLIIFTGELFFRADTLRAGLAMFGSIFRDFDFATLWNGTILNLGLGRADLLAIVLGCIVVGIVGSLKERNRPVLDGLLQARMPLRWAVYCTLILAVVILGAYGSGYQEVDLIYAGF